MDHRSRRVLAGALLSLAWLLCAVYRLCRRDIMMRPMPAKSFMEVTNYSVDSSLLSPAEGGRGEPDAYILIWHDVRTTRTMTEPVDGKPRVIQCRNCSCQFTADRTLLKTSDVVVFDTRGNLNKKEYLPNQHPSHQHWLIMNQEALKKTHSFYNALPGNVFNLSAHYMEKADIKLRYGICEKRTSGSFTLPRDFPNNKTGLVVWDVSHCGDLSSMRKSYVKEMKKLINVDVFGKCGSGRYEEHQRIGVNISDVVIQHYNNYKFYLAFENSFCREYVTEKVFKILEDDVYTVPIVRGGGPYDGILPPGSYIDALEYTPEQLARYLRKLDKNDDLYRKYFVSREKYKCTNVFKDINARPCMLCEGMVHIMETRKQNVLTKENMNDLFDSRKYCFSSKSLKDKIYGELGYSNTVTSHKT